MAQVTVKINGYVYTVGCEDGQEAHLQAMVEQVERRITSIKALGGPNGEARLLVLASLLMADELHDLSNRLDAEPPRPVPSGASPSVEASPVSALADPEAAERLRRLADRAEEIASGLEHP
jgi:cell division protein ZapA